MKQARRLWILSAALLLPATFGFFAHAEEQAAPSAESQPAWTHIAARAEAWAVICSQAKMSRLILSTSSPKAGQPAATEPKRQLLALLKQFLADYPEADNPYSDAALSLLEQLGRGKEPGELRIEDKPLALHKTEKPKDLRRSTEWFTIRLIGGSYGGGGEMGFFSLRWKYLVWEIARGGGMGVGRGLRPNAYRLGWTVYGGSAIGTQLQLGKNPANEIRLMTGLFGGIIEQSSAYSEGPFVLTEVSYVRHVEAGIAYQLGLEVMIATLPGKNHRLPDPMLAGFVGLRI